MPFWEQISIIKHMKGYRFLPYIFFLLIAALLGYTVLDYGMIWDEYLHLQYGNKILLYYLSLGRDKSYNEILNLRYYGGIFDLISEIGFHFSKLLSFKLGICEVKHFFNALFGLTGLISVFFLGKRLNDPWGGYLAVGILMLIPRYYGHMFNNPKDATFAAMFALSMLAAMYYVENLDSPSPWKRAGFLALAIGLCCGIRIAGLFVFLPLGILLLSKLALEKKLADFKLIEKEAVLLIMVILSAYPVMLLGWPWAQGKWSNFWTALQYFSRFKYSIGYLYFGEVVSSKNTPWDYIPVWMGITIPVLTLGLFFAGLWSTIRKLSPFSKESLYGLCLLLWFFLPIGIIIWGKSYLYDELRQILFIFPALALIATEGLLFLWRAINRVTENYSPYIKIIPGLLILSGFLNIAWNMYDLHPYETVYFNQIIGGLKGAHRKFDTDYWCNSFKEVAGFLNHNIPLPAKAVVKCVFGNQSPSLFYYLDKRFMRNPSLGRNVEYLVTTTRHNIDLRYGGEIVFQIERQGVILAMVKKRPVTILRRK